MENSSSKRQIILVSRANISCCRASNLIQNLGNYVTVLKKANRRHYIYVTVSSTVWNGILCSITFKEGIGRHHTRFTSGRIRVAIRVRVGYWECKVAVERVVVWEIYD